MTNQVILDVCVLSQVGNLFLRTERIVIPIPCKVVPCVSPTGNIDVKSKITIDGNDYYTENTIDEINAIIQLAVLATGYWNDDGVWIDDVSWID